MAAMEFLKPGTRTLLAGKTGSGKSTAAAYMLRHSKQCWLIIDPKHDDKIAALNPVYMEKFDVEKVGEIWANGNQYIAFNPPFGATPNDVDGFIGEVFNRYKNFGLGVDELYYIHTQGRAGPGLTAVLTRGRSDKVTFLGCTQRPAWISIFCISEAEFICQFKLSIEKDRLRIYGISGQVEMIDNPPEDFSFWHYDVGAEKIRLIKTR